MTEANDFMLKEDRDLLAVRFEERRRRWEKVRVRGITFYVFFETLRLGGLIVGGHLALDYFSDRSRLQRDLDQYSIGGYALLFFLAALLSTVEWYRNEKKYRRN